MFYERGFESKTRGIVQGDAIRASNIPVSCFEMFDPKIKQNKTLNKREFIISENIIDARNLKIKQSPFVLTWKVVIKARGSDDIIWAMPFAHKSDALILWARLIGYDLERDISGLYMPSFWQEGDFEYHFTAIQSFTTVGAFTWKVPKNVIALDYLIVGGGGSPSDTTPSGGGGGGGVLSAKGFPIQASQYSITVGAATQNSVFGSLTAYRGGSSISDTNCGSGCGGTGNRARNGGAGTAGQGTSGGKGVDWDSNRTSGGGGGGAGAAGSNSSVTVGGYGGDGVQNLITGVAAYYGAGGGGGYVNGNSVAALDPSWYGLGGLGGGGRGAIAYRLNGSDPFNVQTVSGVAGTDGAANTGSGGGGNAYAYGDGKYYGKGGSGIIILSYNDSNGLFFSSGILGT